MKRYKINNTLELAAEIEGDKARIIVFENNKEWVCRKERISVLKLFLEIPEAKIFKGRLQLKKDKEAIKIIVKKEIIGKIYVPAFRQLLST